MYFYRLFTMELLEPKELTSLEEVRNKLSGGPCIISRVVKHKKRNEIAVLATVPTLPDGTYKAEALANLMLRCQNNLGIDRIRIATKL